MNEATEIRLLAERQMGAFLKQMPKATGGASYHKDNREPSSTVTTRADIGIEHHQARRAQKLADIPAQEFREWLAVVKAGGIRLTLGSTRNQRCTVLHVMKAGFT